MLNTPTEKPPSPTTPERQPTPTPQEKFNLGWHFSFMELLQVFKDRMGVSTISEISSLSGLGYLEKLDANACNFSQLPAFIDALTASSKMPTTAPDAPSEQSRILIDTFRNDLLAMLAYRCEPNRPSSPESDSDIEKYSEEIVRAYQSWKKETARIQALHTLSQAINKIWDLYIAQQEDTLSLKIFETFLGPIDTFKERYSQGPLSFRVFQIKHSINMLINAFAKEENLSFKSKCIHPLIALRNTLPVSEEDIDNRGIVTKKWIGDFSSIVERDLDNLLNENYKVEPKDTLPHSLDKAATTESTPAYVFPFEFQREEFPATTSSRSLKSPTLTKPRTTSIASPQTAPMTSEPTLQRPTPLNQKPELPELEAPEDMFGLQPHFQLQDLANAFKDWLKMAQAPEDLKLAYIGNTKDIDKKYSGDMSQLPEFIDALTKLSNMPAQIPSAPSAAIAMTTKQFLADLHEMLAYRYQQANLAPYTENPDPTDKHNQAIRNAYRNRNHIENSDQPLYADFSYWIACVFQSLDSAVLKTIEDHLGSIDNLDQRYAHENGPITLMVIRDMEIIYHLLPEEDKKTILIPIGIVLQKLATIEYIPQYMDVYDEKPGSFLEALKKASCKSPLCDPYERDPYESEPEPTVFSFECEDRNTTATAPDTNPSPTVLTHNNALIFSFQGTLEPPSTQQKSSPNISSSSYAGAMPSTGKEWQKTQEPLIIGPIKRSSIKPT